MVRQCFCHFRAFDGAPRTSPVILPAGSANIASLGPPGTSVGGKYAADKGEAYVAAAEEMTDRVDAVVKSIATETGSGYVDLRAAFKGPSYAYDETHYLSNDGDHPNAAGHRQIAAATDAVLEKSVHV